MSNFTKEDELALGLAIVACEILVRSEPLKQYKGVEELNKAISKMTDEEKNQLILEVLVFEIFSVAYGCQVFKLSSDFLYIYQLNVYKLISENNKIMQIIKNKFFGK